MNAKHLAAVWATVTGVATFVGVAPFSCDGDGWCHGLVAFGYAPWSAGFWQAAGAAAVIAGVTWLLVWLAASPRRKTLPPGRLAVSVLLAAGAVISLLSQSVLLVAGPLISGSFLWLMWRRPLQRS